jgi:hypothetical protein
MLLSMLLGSGWDVLLLPDTNASTVAYAVSNADAFSRSRTNAIIDISAMYAPVLLEWGGLFLPIHNARRHKQVIITNV